jgi:hypothetical protein
MDKVQKPISSQCYILSSEPFRIYLIADFASDIQEDSNLYILSR